MNIVLLGGPGAGKGTQSEFLIEDYGMLHISTGDLLRDAVKRQTEAGLKAKRYMDAGNLVPDEVILGIMQDKFENSDISNGLILDGFPRTLRQAEELDVLLKDVYHYAIGGRLANEAIQSDKTKKFNNELSVEFKDYEIYQGIRLHCVEGDIDYNCTYGDLLEEDYQNIPYSSMDVGYENIVSRIRWIYRMKNK